VAEPGRAAVAAAAAAAAVAERTAGGASDAGASAAGASRKGADNEDLAVPNGRANGGQPLQDPSRPSVHDLVRVRVRVRP